ncbi:MAG: STAS domain-containing protein [Nitrospira sp.]|nr:STAS domain-containing protein [bacterium]MBL7047958.1 STAS domain-containing protein [Nitrospira sp.]
MTISEETLNTIVILKFKGRLDASSAKAVKDKVGLLVKNGRPLLVFDMEAVDFIDSSGLGVLVASLRTVNKVEGDIKIASLQAQVRSIFELTRMHRLFEIFDSSTAAAESYTEQTLD